MNEANSGFLFTFFNPAVAAQYWHEIARGMVVTIGVGAATVVTGVAAGLVLALARATGRAWLRLPVVLFSDITRSLPPLVIIILLYFGLPALGMPLSSFTSTWLSLSLVLAAYAQESIWAGLSSLPKGQMEAARSTGLGWWQAMRWVLLPQALRRAVPPLTNRVIATTKNTALGSVVALSEILSTAQASAAVAGNPTPLTVGAFLYLLVFLPLVFVARTLEHRSSNRN
ncbi:MULTISPECIES: amino acid ABC transporter permease [Variovorax]|jgi:polar amino acid transport system permease protein|uniref:amino acid ABC transporter permease n=1 Tax=Variovorax TaxID=34072 RepID=UPI00036591B1|nr:MULTISPECIES: amino acid ABC transporter permease [Variovorax]MBB3641948.1 polar amino acid transport system permease protein [Variovorax sp. BK613]MDR6522604.1 polar amino acid transport system permease protein [Variovorax paradoxus]RTD84006.1 amino acid ABC transporter permease [Variovorax sp. 369]